MDNAYTPADISGTGTQIDRRSLIMGLGLTAAGAASYLATPNKNVTRISENDFRRLIPESAGGWTSKSSSQLVLPTNDELQKKLYENLDTRVYEGPGLPSIMFLLAYSSKQQDDIQVHRPEVCYPVAGFPIKESSATTVDFASTKINALELVADRKGTNERILYWVRVGDEYPTDFWMQRLSMAKMSLTTGIPDGLLLRVSVFEQDENYSRRALKSFVQAFSSASSNEFKRRVLLANT